jgi:hypothetical protein
MRKRELFAWVLVALLFASTVYAAVWSTYNELTAGNIANGDDFLVRDVSDTTFAETGTQKRYSWQSLKADLGYSPIEFLIDGGGSAITTGVKGDIEIPMTGTIQRATCLCDQTGSIVVDIWVDTYGNFPPTSADSITAAAPVTVGSATKSQDSTLTGWTKSLTAGHIMRFNVNSASTVERCTVSLMVQK